MCSIDVKRMLIENDALPQNEVEVFAVEFLEFFGDEIFCTNAFNISTRVLFYFEHFSIYAYALLAVADFNLLGSSPQ